MKDLHELLDLCYEKGFTFSLAPEMYLITVLKIDDDVTKFNYCSYYDGELKDYISSYTTTVSGLIQKVKEYESK